VVGRLALRVETVNAWFGVSLVLATENSCVFGLTLSNGRITSMIFTAPTRQTPLQ